MPDKTDAKILTVSIRELEDALLLCRWWLSNRTWNPLMTYGAWMKQLMWLRIILSEDWCLHLVLHTPSGAWQRRRIQKY